MAKGDLSSTIIRRDKVALKTLFSIFFKSNSPLLINHVEKEQTINPRYYIDNCLQLLLDEIKHQRPSCCTNRIMLHQDNRRPHLHKNVSDYLESEDITTTPHPSILLVCRRATSGYLI